MLSFVRVARAKLINDLTTRETIACDPGYLFLTNRGRRIDPETVTQDFHRLKRAAGIKSKASGHMLRHRWITLQVTERVNAYATKRLPVDIGTTLLTKVASLTGHSLVSSLKPYLHLATEELAIWDQGGQNFDDRSERDARDRARR